VGKYMEKYIEMKLVKSLKKGDDEAFMRLVREFTPSLRAWLTMRLYGHQDIDDLTQETFIAAYKAKERLHDDSNLDVWLKGIARNKLRHFYRTQSRSLKMKDSFQKFVSASIDIEDNDIVQSEDHYILQKCIRKLPFKLSQLVNLRHLNGIKVKEIAVTQKCSESHVSVNLFRARQKLRQCLEKNR
jgi:RNA polymerase sigma-70 factor, ECF subfamily